MYNKKRLNRALRGLRTEWSVVDPLAEMKENDFIETRLVYPSIAARNLIEPALLDIKPYLLSAVFFWEVLIEIEFKEKNRDSEFVIASFSESTKFSNLEETINSTIEDIFEQNSSRMGNYVTTHMTAKILR